LSDTLDGIDKDGAAFTGAVKLGGQFLLGVGARARQINAQGDHGWAYEADDSLLRAPVSDGQGWAVIDHKRLHYFKLTDE
jgi:hypothetical protein